MENETTYTGTCHCGAVAFEATMQPVTEVLSCNCSHCSKKGFLLHFIPKEKFTQTKGEDNMTEYRFNKKQIAHLFCKTCGVQAFGYGSDPAGNVMVALNMRCVDDIDLGALKINEYNGKDF